MSASVTGRSSHKLAGPSDPSKLLRGPKPSLRSPWTKVARQANGPSLQLGTELAKVEDLQG
eukprot:7637120-Alexandrium_andersonii.AAC.1